MKFFPTFLLALLALPLAALAAPPTPVSVESAEATEAAEAAEAAEVAEAAEAGKECTIHARWEGTWIEYGLSRYRVRMWNEGGERNLTDHLCVFFWSTFGPLPPSFSLTLSLKTQQANHSHTF